MTDGNQTPPPTPEPPLEIECAWCADFKPRAAGDRPKTHTICPACLKRIFPERIDT